MEAKLHAFLIPEAAGGEMSVLYSTACVHCLELYRKLADRRPRVAP
jgi:hypothetical protein